MKIYKDKGPDYVEICQIAEESVGINVGAYGVKSPWLELSVYEAEKLAKALNYHAKKIKDSMAEERRYE